jgi:2-amino-4-hydroxy-6-hydroxymethyldihydropteridine diphosphokinase
MPTCLIGLGSNLGDRQATLGAAVAALRGHPQIHVLAVSSWHETTHIGGPPQPPYLNGAAQLETALPPLELLAVLQQIENRLGRVRTEHWGERTIDLDLLLYDDEVLNTPTLTVPHPRMAVRRFVLEPAAEIAGVMRHPVVGWTVARLLEHLNDAPRYIAIAGPIGVGKTHLAKELASAASAEFLAERPDWPSLDAFYADPVHHALEVESQFLAERTALLSSSERDWREGRWKVSDFWFDQSAAFARAWLTEEQSSSFTEHYQTRRRTVMSPRLLVVLDLPGEELLTRIARRGRACEQRLTLAQVERIRSEVSRQAHQPDVGPVLFLDNHDEKAVFVEVLAALQGMT